MRKRKQTSPRRSGARSRGEAALTRGCAPGKVILFGEHAVVYGRPAIAVPVTEVRAEVFVQESDGHAGITIHAGDIGRVIDVQNAPSDEPLALTVRNTLAHIGVDPADVRLTLTVRSTIPVASGLGSGAAVSTAIVRALGAQLGHPLDATDISAIVYETEKIHHGTPSGIDNSVVAFERAVYFSKGQPIETFDVKRPFYTLIVDTGISSPTKVAVADVRAAWEDAPERYDLIFDQIGALTRVARQAMENGHIDALGPLMNENHGLLRQLDVSSPELETLVVTARQQGAKGAKLSGGGRGGNMIALVEPRDGRQIERALLAAGAERVIVTRVG